MTLEQALQRYFRYHSFRPGQKDVIEAVLEKQDVLAVLPTGAGKSICYQLPALLLPGLTLVISPLLSLMEDQVQQLKSNGIKQVASLNSITPFALRRKILQRLHTYKMLYLSPEMLQAEDVRQALASVSVSLFVIDEAHCISQWGHEFRTDYLKLKDVRASLHSPPYLALTATATRAVQDDIIQQLEMVHVKKCLFSVDRNNIALSIQRVDDIEAKVSLALQLVQTLAGPGLIYFATRGWTETFASLLREHGVDKVAHYHGGMDGESRLLIQQQFVYDQLELICCTNAFGMGINKKNIRYVIHFHHPTDMESYVQEIGRAGRDGEQSLAILLYTNEDGDLANRLMQIELPTKRQIYDVAAFLMKDNSSHSLVSDAQLMSEIGLGEVGFKSLKYYLEQEKLAMKKSDSLEQIVEKVTAIYEQRRKEKMKKLFQFQRFLETNDCLRKQYVRYFSETSVKLNTICCDRCDVKLLDNFVNKKRLTTKEKDDRFNWEKRLRDIFHIM